MLGDQALRRFAQYTWESCLDIGSGPGIHADALRSIGKHVLTIDLGDKADIRGSYLEHSFPNQFDAIWCCHVLEHQVDPGAFLRKIHSDLVEGGILAVTVPPLKHEIVGGHVTLWNAGLLLYQLILAGFDCRAARVGSYGYNISVLVQKTTATLPPLVCDHGDIERIAHLFPFKAYHGFHGQLPDMNW